MTAALAGCGGGSEEGATGGPPVAAEPLTRAEFLEQADAICFSSESRIEAAADELVTADERPRPGEVAAIARRVVVPALEAEVRAIEALGAPRGDEEEVAAILEATERGIVQIEADPAGLLDGAPPALREANRLARAYGSRQCGLE